MRMVVVLPAPLGPRKPTTSPRPIWNETSSTALRTPKILVAWSTSIVRSSPCPRARRSVATTVYPRPARARGTGARSDQKSIPPMSAPGGMPGIPPGMPPCIPPGIPAGAGGLGWGRSADERLGGQDHRGDARAVLQSRLGHLDRVDYAHLHQVAERVGLGIEAVVALALLDGPVRITSRRARRCRLSARPASRPRGPRPSCR